MYDSGSFTFSTSSAFFISSSLIGAYEGVYINQGEKLPENIPWKFIAQMLLAAAYYE